MTGYPLTRMVGQQPCAVALQSPVDYQGNLCGTETESMDLRQDKYVYVGDPTGSPETSAICVPECPMVDTENPNVNKSADAFVCRYRWRSATYQEKLSQLGANCWQAVPTQKHMY